MATIADALRLRVLEGYAMPDWERRQPTRPLYCAGTFFDEIDGDERLLSNQFKDGGRILHEQLEQMFCDFCCAIRPSAAELKRLMPTRKRVWKMHPVGLRVYGWCPGTHSFVAITYALLADTKTDRTLNDKKREEVIEFAKRHKLEGTMAPGDYSALFPK